MAALRLLAGMTSPSHAAKLAAPLARALAIPEHHHHRYPSGAASAAAAVVAAVEDALVASEAEVATEIQSLGYVLIGIYENFDNHQPSYRFNLIFEFVV